MKKNAALFAMILAIISSSKAFAGVEEYIRGNAKFNVVIVVLAIIFIGIILFLFRLDRKIGKLEKQQESKK